MNIKEKLSQQARVALLGGVCLLAGAGAVFTQTAAAREEKAAPRLKLKVDDQTVDRDQTQNTAFPFSFAPVVKEVAASVVSVTTETKPKQIPGLSSPFGNNPFFRQFFGDAFEGGRMMTPRQHGLGSGVIVTEDGYILTNNHVVEGADEITVILNPDGKEYPARVVGRDPKSEVAVLKIEATGLPAIRFGNSDKVQVGDVVLAIGNPFGVGQTVTMGIVGATGRALGRSMGLDYQDFIQTDAAINPGNSGGALVDAQGRLIGINTAILSRDGGNNGVGFAIPTQYAKSVMESLIEHGRVIRGFLGVKIQDLNPGLAGEFGLKQAEGALIADVSAKSPAEKAGLKPGDVITQFDGRSVRDSRHLSLMVSQTAPEKEVTVSLVRDGKAKDVDVVLKELPEDRQMAGLRRGQNPQGSGDIGGLQGVVVGDLTPELRQELGIPRNLQGAVVTDVEEDSVAARAGLRRGDLILEINRKEIRDSESAIEAVRDLENSSILLRVWRDGGSRWVRVDESKSSE